MHNLFKELGIEHDINSFEELYNGPDFGACCKTISSAIEERCHGGEVQVNPDRMEIVTIQDETVYSYVGPSEKGGYIGLVRK